MKKLNNKGFTLTEALIAVSVMAILLTIIANFSITSLSNSTITTAQANLQGESQIAMDSIINDIRLSSGADDSNRWPDINNSGGDYAWQSDAANLVLAKAVLDGADNIIFADPAQYISEKNNVIYFVKDKVLYKRVLASPVANNSSRTTCPKASATTACPADRELLTNVTEFSIKYFNGDEQEVTPTDARSIELTVKTSVKKFSRNITSDYTTRAVFRND